MNHDSHVFRCPLGILELAAWQGKLTHIALLQEPPALPLGTVSLHQALFERAEKEIFAYLEGKLQQFTLPVQPRGTEFQQRIWEELQRIPYGETVSYTELATRAGNPLAVRAAGTACGHNPVPIIIPCHRVLRSNGTLGGFGWGLPIKSALLSMEQKQVARKAA